MTTASLYTFTDWVYNLLMTNSVSLGLQLVTYGDQLQLPVTPAACVEPDNKQNSYKGMQRAIYVDFQVSVYVYYGKVDSIQQNKREADQLGESIETLLHKDPTCGGLVTKSLVTAIEPGYADKVGTLYRTTKITFTGGSQDRLPAAPWI